MHTAERFRPTWHYIKFDKHEALASHSPYRPLYYQRRHSNSQTTTQLQPCRRMQTKPSPASLIVPCWHPPSLSRCRYNGHVYHEDDDNIALRIVERLQRRIRFNTKSPTYLQHSWRNKDFGKCRMWNFLLPSGKWHCGLWYTGTKVLKKDEGMRTLWNVGTCQPNYTAWGHSEMLVPVNQTTYHEGTLKFWYMSTKLHSMRTLWTFGTCQPSYISRGHSEFLVPVNQITQHQSQSS